MPDQELKVKATAKDIAARIKSIQKTEGLSTRVLSARLNNNNIGIEVSHSMVARAILAEGEIPTKLVIVFALVMGYSPTWLLLGVGEKKLSKESKRIITDIQIFRVELEIERAWRKVAEARMDQQDKKIAYLERELKEKAI